MGILSDAYEEAEEYRRKLEDVTTLFPVEEWREDDGCVIWWHLPVCEPPYIGAGPGAGEELNGEPPRHLECPCWVTGRFQQVPCPFHDGHGQYPSGSYAKQQRKLQAELDKGRKIPRGIESGWLTHWSRIPTVLDIEGKPKKIGSRLKRTSPF